MIRRSAVDCCRVDVVAHEHHLSTRGPSPERSNAETMPEIVLIEMAGSSYMTD